ncbi:MAG: Mrp/NBP35 family ATP-binding protein [Actinomycetota bacterium]
MPTDAEAIEAVSAVIDPEIERPLGELGMVKGVSVAGTAVQVMIALPVETYPSAHPLSETVGEALAGLGGVESVDVQFGLMGEEEQEALRRTLIGDPESTAGSGQAHGHAEGRAIPFADPASRTRTLLVASGKGGVGKSSVTVNLGIALARRGKSVAVVDADVWGYSIPRMLGVTQPPMVIDKMLVPPLTNGVRCISMGFFADEDQPVIWRGPMLHKALEQFLTDVWWNEPDFLVVDLPPGTGDISLSLAQFLPRGEVYVVTTPQAAAQSVAQRAAFMAQKVQLEVRGVIENMSWFTGDDGKRYPIFGAGGGAHLAEKLEVPLVGQVPLVPDLREGGDVGAPIMAEAPGSEAGEVFAAMAERIDVELAPTRRHHPELKLI